MYKVVHVRACVCEQYTQVLGVSLCERTECTQWCGVWVGRLCIVRCVYVRPPGQYFWMGTTVQHLLNFLGSGPSSESCSISHFRRLWNHLGALVPLDKKVHSNIIRLGNLTGITVFYNKHSVITINVAVRKKPVLSFMGLSPYWNSQVPICLEMLQGRSSLLRKNRPCPAWRRPDSSCGRSKEGEGSVHSNQRRLPGGRRMELTWKDDEAGTGQCLPCLLHFSENCLPLGWSLAVLFLCWVPVSL